MLCRPSTMSGWTGKTFAAGSERPHRTCLFVVMHRVTCVSAWRITQVGSRPGCTLSRLPYAVFTINMLITCMRSDTDTCGMKCTCCPRAVFPPLFFSNFTNHPPSPVCLSSKSCGGKLAVSSRQDKLTVSRCVRNEGTQVWALFLDPLSPFRLVLRQCLVS